jgi:hypothetical protein
MASGEKERVMEWEGEGEREITNTWTLATRPTTVLLFRLLRFE